MDAADIDALNRLADELELRVVEYQLARAVSIAEIDDPCRRGAPPLRTPRDSLAAWNTGSGAAPTSHRT